MAHAAAAELARAGGVGRERGEALAASRPAVLRTLHKALRARRRVSILYASRSRRETRRRKIEPLHLTYCEGQWYVLAFCCLRRAIRLFVPARMRQARLLAEWFEPPNGFDPQAHFRSAFGVVAGRNVATVALAFDAEVAPIIRERHWHATEALEELPNGGVRLRLTCSQGDELKSWLLGWAGHVTVEADSACTVCSGSVFEAL